MSRNILKLLLILMIFGCTSSRHRPENLPEPLIQKPAAEISPELELKANDFPKEISRLEAMIPVNTDSSFQIKAHLRLAFLYLDSLNPNPSYPNALKELELYVSLDPEGGKKIEIKNLLKALREVWRLADENKKIRLKIEQVVKENAEIKKTVEELRNLDLRIEERRRQVK